MKQRKHSSIFKAPVALEDIRGDMAVAEISKKHQVRPGQAQAWKTEALSKFGSVFDKGSASEFRIAIASSGNAILKI